MVPEDESYKANLSFLGFTGDFPFHFVPQSHIHRRSLRMRDQLVQLEYPNDDLPHVLDFTQGMIEVMMSKGEIAVFSGDLWHAGGGCRGKTVDLRFFTHADSLTLYEYPHEKEAYPLLANDISQGNVEKPALTIKSKHYFNCSTYSTTRYFDFLKNKTTT